METQIKNYGFIKPEIKPEDYFFGGVTKISGDIVNPSGQWLNYLPTKEWQWKKFSKGDMTYYVESFGCTGFGTLACIETLHKFQFGEEINWSDRCINIEAGNSKTGNNPQNPAEALRKLGCCKEEALPFDETCISWELFHSPKPLTPELVKLAKEFVDKYEFKHEWVTAKDKNVLMESLKRSPLGISVCAWKTRNGLFYKEKGEADNHWVSLVGYELNKCWYIFDSYDSFIKKLEWDYDFGFAKRYYLKKKLTEVESPQTNNMYSQLYKEIGTPHIWIKSAANNKYYRIDNMDVFNKLFTNENLQKAVECVIPNEYKDDVLTFKGLFKKSLLTKLLTEITNIVNNLAGKIKGKK